MSADKPATLIALLFAQGDRGGEVVVKHGETLYSIEGLRKSGLMAVGPMESIVLQQLADKMRGLALKLDARMSERGGVR